MQRGRSAFGQLPVRRYSGPYDAGDTFSTSGCGLIELWDYR